MAEIAVQERIAADPVTVYGMVSDVTRMGEWSPETTSCRWQGGADSAVVGARFIGTNRHGWRRWSTVCTVTAADPGRRFAFDVRAAGFTVARWEYEFEPDGDGCLVTERWTDLRRRWMERLSPLVTGAADRSERNRSTMVETLARLREAAGP